MMRKLNVVLTAAAAMTLSAAPLSAQWGDIFGRSSDQSVPSGMCRVWIDGVAANRQPRATDCRTAERERPYYEQRYGRRARVIYGNRTNRNDRYDTRPGAIVLGKRNGDGTVYGDRTGTNCRYVERVIAGRVVTQRVCDNNGGVYDRNGQIYDRNGQVYDRNGRVYDRNGNIIYRRDDVYRRDRNDRSNGRWGRNDRDSDDKGRGKYKNKNKNKRGENN
jgi:hypothetical protein